VISFSDAGWCCLLTAGEIAVKAWGDTLPDFNSRKMDAAFRSFAARNLRFGKFL
jgi:hypothetical protein